MCGRGLRTSACSLFAPLREGLAVDRRSPVVAHVAEVHLGTTAEDVKAVAAEEAVVPCLSAEHVVATKGLNGVVAGATEEAVGASPTGTGDVVVPTAAVDDGAAGQLTHVGDVAIVVTKRRD